VITERSQFYLAVTVIAFVLMTGCVASEPRPQGVSWRMMFSVSPLYPKSFEIIAAGSRSLGTEELKRAWQKKAELVANGRPFKASALIVHDNETDTVGTYWPMQTRSVTGIITLSD
jgi:hypothetical protein